MTTKTTETIITATEDRLAILELIGSLALLLDARDWNALEGLFTSTAIRLPHDKGVS
jgi:hypothetical protein